MPTTCPLGDRQGEGRKPHPACGVEIILDNGVAHHFALLEIIRRVQEPVFLEIPQPVGNDVRHPVHRTMNAEAKLRRFRGRENSEQSGHD
jgi:hypothetical protein